MKKFWKHKSKFAAIALVLLMASVLLTFYMPVQAYWTMEKIDYGWRRVTYDELTNVQDSGGRRLPSGVTPDMEFKVDPYLSFRPNPVGVGQTILVNMWSVPGPAYTRYFTDYTVTITDPDGNEDVIKVDSYRADSTAWFEYVVDQVGEWTLKFDFPGQYFPAGNYTTPPGVGQADYFESFTHSLYYKPTSTPERTLTVQEEMVLSWPPSALPTDYWTRPVAKEHREWWTILGNYPWHGPGGGPVWDELYPDTSPIWEARHRFTPWVQGPESAHLAWKQYNGLDAGLVGGDYGSYFETGSGGTPNIIYNGKCYDSVEKPFNGETQDVWVCYDLRTGEVYWELTGVSAPSYIEYSMGLPSVPGAEAAVSFSAALVGISGDTLRKFDPETGEMTLEREIPDFRSNTYYSNGLVLSVQDLGNYSYRLINWTTAGTTGTFANRILSNISWPRRDLGLTAFQDWSTFRSFQARELNTPDPPGGFPFVDITYDNTTGFRYGTLMLARSMITGETLWNFTLFESSFSPSCGVADHGKVAVLMQDQATPGGGGYFMCFDQVSGKVLWKSEQMDSPWDIPGFGAYSIASAYGLLYRNAYSGVYAFDWDDGSIVWKYEAPAFSPYETPYTDADGNTMYSFNAGGWVADGKYYAYNTEHSTSQPITRGWGIHCMDAITGEFIWKTKIWGSLGPIVDGYLTVSGYDGYMYVFGKGKSATTITASPKTIADGDAVLLEGTVLDMSPAQPGTPCVSKESMATQMEYLHMQMPIAGIWNNETITGVPVSLDTLDPNGNFIHIGDVTSDGYSGTFGHAWTPEVPGTYAVMATFMGDESYGSSFAQTYVTVGEAPEPYPEPPEYGTPEWPAYPEAPAYTAVDLAIIAAVAVAIVIGIISLLDHRRLRK